MSANIPGTLAAAELVTVVGVALAVVAAVRSTWSP
jgi:hypothetical protein